MQMLRSCGTLNSRAKRIFIIFVLQLIRDIFLQRPSEVREELIQIFPVIPREGEPAMFPANNMLQPPISIIVIPKFELEN